MPIALSITNLQKTYANNVQALKGIDIQVAQGDFFALLGSNGAGKTTAISIICGLLYQSSGAVEVLGFNQQTQANEVKRLIGLMPQEFNFNPFEPIGEILLNQAGYHGINRQQALPEVERLLKAMQLWDKRRDIARNLSGGMKRRLMLARALIHRPKILILDEPTAGVDVEIRHSIWEFLQTLNQQGTTIILTTHYLEEAESLCRNIAILNAGKVVEQSPMKQLLAKSSQQVLILESVDVLPQSLTSEHFKCQRLDDYTMRFILSSDKTITDVLLELSAQDIKINHVRSAQNRLESLFLNLNRK